MKSTKFFKKISVLRYQTYTKEVLGPQRLYYYNSPSREFSTIWYSHGEKTYTNPR